MISQKLIVLIVLVAAIAVASSYFIINSGKMYSAVPFLKQAAKQGQGNYSNSTISSSNIPIPPFGTNSTNGTINANNSAGGGGAGGNSGSGQQTSGISNNSESKGPITLETLKILSLCSADTNSSLQVFEGAECYVSNPPFSMVFVKNGTIIQTNFYDYQGYNATYNISSDEDTTPVFKIFSQNLMTIGTTDVTPQVTGTIAPYLKLGDISINDVYAEEPDIHQVQKNPVILTRIISFPVFMKNNIPSFTLWQKASFYLSAPNDTYFIGDVWMYITSS